MIHVLKLLSLMKTTGGIGGIFTRPPDEGIAMLSNSADHYTLRMAIFSIPVSHFLPGQGEKGHNLALIDVNIQSPCYLLPSSQHSPGGERDIERVSEYLLNRCVQSICTDTGSCQALADYLIDIPGEIRCFDYSLQLHLHQLLSIGIEAPPACQRGA